MEPNSQISENIEESSSINPSKSPKKTQEQEEPKEITEGTENAQKNPGESKILNIPPKFPKIMKSHRMILKLIKP